MQFFWLLLPQQFLRCKFFRSSITIRNLKFSASLKSPFFTDSSSSFFSRIFLSWSTLSSKYLIWCMDFTSLIPQIAFDPFVEFNCVVSRIFKFMAHSAVWDRLPIQRQNTNSKKLTIEKLCKNGLRKCTKFGQVHSNNERKITLSLILHFILDFRI